MLIACFKNFHPLFLRKVCVDNLEESRDLVVPFLVPSSSSTVLCQLHFNCTRSSAEYFMVLIALWRTYTRNVRALHEKNGRCLVRKGIRQVDAISLKLFIACLGGGLAGLNGRGQGDK